MGMAVMVLGAIAGGSYLLIKRLDDSKQDAVKEIKYEKGRVESQKILGLSGFLISNNLILCKQDAWGDGSEKNQCKWMGQQKDKNYRPEEFGLKNLRYNKGDLVFDLETRRANKNSNNIKYPSSVRFRLADVNKNDSLKAAIGDIPKEVKFIDRDHYVVLVKSEVKIPGKSGEEMTVQGAGAFKRPIAIPKIEVRSSSCQSQCNTSLSEHLNPACRGRFSIDTETKTDIEIITYNQGPGVIYDLDYERKVVFADGIKVANIPANEKVEIPLTDYIPPDHKETWNDRVPCGTFVKKVTKTVVRRGNNSSNSNRSISQHSEPAGRVVYKLDAISSLSNIEPFRLNEKVVTENGEIKGKMDETTTTIYVSPPH